MTPMTPRLKKCIENALADAKQEGDEYCTTGHMLLALLRETDGIAAMALGYSDADAIRLTGLIRALENSPACLSAKGETA